VTIWRTTHFYSPKYHNIDIHDGQIFRSLFFIDGTHQGVVYIDVEDHHPGPVKPTDVSVIPSRSGCEQLTGQLVFTYKIMQFVIRLSN
jgi:hypothetical protein